MMIQRVGYILLVLFVVTASAQTPHRDWATYFGGMMQERGWDIAVDHTGYVYMVGETQGQFSKSPFFNNLSGACDAYITKFDPQGQVIWARYFGGPAADGGRSVATDLTGNIYLAGITNSQTGIAFNAFQPALAGDNDAFVAKFRTDGTLIWSTYFGGPASDAFYQVRITTDTTGNVFLCGITHSTSGIAHAGYQNTFGGSNCDAYLVKFDSSGNRLWATYFGGYNDDFGHGVACDKEGNVYLAGRTMSPGLAYNGYLSSTIGVDAFLVKFDANGNRIWSTYYGGSQLDYGATVATDSKGNVYLSGFASSGGGIAWNGYQNTLGGAFDAFIVKFDSTCTRKWATYFGGPGKEGGNISKMLVDKDYNVHIVGYTDSNSGIAYNGFQPSYGEGSHDGYLARFDSTGQLINSSYYGGPSLDACYGVAIDQHANMYFCGYTYSDTSIAALGYQAYRGGSEDAFLVKFGEKAQNPLSLYNVNEVKLPRIYPNPTSGSIAIKYQGRNQPSNVIVRQIDGRKLLERSFTKDEALEIDMRGRPAGLYVLELTNAELRLVSKVILK